MIKAGTRVTVNMDDPMDSPIIKLLNSLGGEVIKVYPENSPDTPNALVAYDVEHLPAIKEAMAKHFGTKVKVQLPIVGLNRSLGMPKDERYYLLASLREISPA